jgi:cytosine permease
MDSLPNYLEAAKPVPKSNRVPWYLSSAQTYAGVMLWFAFWQVIAVGPRIHEGFDQYSAFAGGVLSHGVLLALASVVVAALICHFLFYLVPGLLGFKSGLPLYVVGTSTYGAYGGFLMPGFLMGLLQFGWLGVSSYFSAKMLCEPFGYGAGSFPHAAVAIVWAIAAAVVGLKGIRYVAGVNTFAPIVPLVALAILTYGTLSGVANFNPQTAIDAGLKTTITLKDVAHTQIHALPALSSWGVFCLIVAYIVGFFATAGAAGVDFGMNNRNTRDVHLGGLVGIALATVVSGGLAMLIVAGGLALGIGPDKADLQATHMFTGIIGSKGSGVMMWLLALAAFPSSCFSSLIAANSFKTTLPKINPWISVGIGTLGSITLAVTGLAGNVMGVFTVIGASFGPICGAMAADYLLAGCKWPGPRAGFNPAGWISWAVGFVVGGAGLAAELIPALKGIVPEIPCPPVAAFIVGFVLYAVLAKIGIQTRTLKMPQVDQPG